MKAVYRYLKGSPGKGLFFEKKPNHQVSGYTDAYWAGDRTDGKSTSGYFTFIGGNLVTWRSKKQKVVARSSAEAEYRGMVHAAVNIANNPVQHDRTKHVQIDRHFIKDQLEKKTIELPHVNSKDQLADMRRKSFS
ncbi:putative RNA-directed DNA polymerase [Tanacetum coccineum]